MRARLVTFATTIAMLAGVQATSSSTAAPGLEVVLLEPGHSDTSLCRAPILEVGLIDANRGTVDEALSQLDAWAGRDAIR